MQPFLSRFLRRRPFIYAAILLGAGCLLGACDRHSAAELPENYGHGSSHQKSYTDHQADSRTGSHSFSDTQGIELDKDKK